MNSVGRERTDIWSPSFYLDNTRDKVENVLDGKSLLRVIKNGSGVVSSHQETESKLIFKGSENFIEYERFYSEKFQCDFSLHWYPFDRQTCYIDINPTSTDKVRISLNVTHLS